MSNNENLPNNIQAEISVLGAMLMRNGEAIIKIQSILNSEDFYRKENGIVYQAILDVYAKKNMVDLITLNEQLQKDSLLEKIGGPAYIMTIGDSTPTSANIVSHAKIVKEKSILRKLIHASESIIKDCYDDQEDLKTIMEKVEHKIFSITSGERKGEFEHIASVITRVYDKINYLYEHNGGYTGVESGFKDIDEATAGLQNSDFILLAARPSMGKTAFALNIATNISMGSLSRKPKPVAIFSLEMSKEQLAQRMLSTVADIDSNLLRTGQIPMDSWSNLERVTRDISKAKLYIDDTPGLSVTEIRARAKNLKNMYGLDLLIIDYLQLMQGRKNRNGEQNRQQEISEISRSLKALARELNIPIIALSQLSRAVEMRSEKRPQLSDLRESGSLEQDADMVWFLYRDDYYKQTTENQNLTELIIAKHRNGPTKTLNLHFEKSRIRFASLERVRSED